MTKRVENSNRLSQATVLSGRQDAALYVRQGCLTLQTLRIGAGADVGCFTFNPMCRSRSCIGSAVLGESAIRHVPLVVFVAQIGNLLFRRLAACIAPPCTITPADFQSATQQTNCLRYVAGGKDA